MNSLEMEEDNNVRELKMKKKVIKLYQLQMELEDKIYKL